MTGVDPSMIQAAMVRLQDGDRSAFDVVYAGLWPIVRGTCHRILNQPADAEDAAQQTLLALFERAHEFDPARSVIGWAVTLAAWEARTLKRRQGRRRESQPPDTIEQTDPGATPDAIAVRRDLIAHVDAIVATLSPLDRQTINAALTGNAPAGATHRKRRQRAWARLRAAWSHRHG